jgi:Ca2+-transporting ATPase
MHAPNFNGLSQQAAVERLRCEGPNELGLNPRRKLRTIVVEVVREPMFLLLLGTGAIYLAMGDAHDAFLLLGFVLIIMGITIVQERRTDNTLEALRDLSSPRALVLRDGQPVRLPGREVVRGDLLMLAEGDRVPADGELLEAHELAVDESMLTGESEAVAKAASPTAAATLNQVFAGTLAIRGQGLVRVTAIGRHTSLGQIGQSLEAIGLQSSPLKGEIGRLTGRLVVVALVLSVGLAALFAGLRGGLVDAVLAGITLAMSLLPQEFPVIMIVMMALGARRMAARQVLTRRLNAIETLGEATVLCVDKTGTLTENRMAVAALWIPAQTLRVGDLRGDALPEPFHELLEYAVLASEIEPHDPMEQAFHQFGQRHLADTGLLHPKWSLSHEYELTPELMAMTHLWTGEAGTDHVAATKGAPEAVVKLCTLPDSERQALAEQAGHMADSGLRVLAVAKARHPMGVSWPDHQHELDFELVGLIGLADPLRADVPNAVAQCQRAGIRVVMITGDHPRTARSIAQQAGIDHGEVITGDELTAMPDAALAERVAQVHVFARVQPAQKLRLVEALKARGEVVAMTGDGVNDAPALKAAHIGIAMGQRGTDVAREAAALVLLDDQFVSIVEAVRLGRRIVGNLRQAMIYTLAVHVPIVGLALAPVVLGLPLMFAPLHIAFLELVMNPACSLVFEAQEGHPGLMNQPPRPRSEPLLGPRRIALGLLQGGLVALLVVGLYALALARGISVDVARTWTFVVLVSANAALILPGRSSLPEWTSLWRGLTPTSAAVIGVTLLALFLVTNVPVLAAPFSFTSLRLPEWLGALAVGVAMALPLQAAKRVLQPA